ncbi:MAG: 2-oxoacid:acceptor oxidoreductase subunit alpha [Chloroflexota bacterium]|nr:MAG: 2-oxoacid:acceptor oxidoreductase subunit alpha [Chloroflexota bacterium]
MAHDLTIRVAGETGEGVQSTGILLAQATARGGFYVLTYWTVPAEIKGGHALFQVRLGDHQMYAQSDRIDILLAFNQEAYDRNTADLRDGGLLLYDSAEYTPPETTRWRQLPVPLTDIAKNQLKFELGKNVVAVGVCSALFGLPTQYAEKLLRDRWQRKGEDIVQVNMRALQAGIDYVEQNVTDRAQYLIEAPPPRPNTIVLSGAQSLSLGTLAAGANFFAGYPITPASDVMEFLATELPKVGGTVVQAEDEMAAITMCLGASYAGAKTLTATSGPGFSLMIEALGLGTMAELPFVLVDAQRAGPSTGLPTRHEQGDLYLAALGGHGEVPRIVLATTSVEDSFYLAIHAFNLAETYQCPVILMSDTVLMMRMEAIPKPDVESVRVIDRLLYSPESNGRANGRVPGVPVHPEEGGYRRYAPTENGVSPMSLPGMAGGQYVATGLEHNETGRPRYDEYTHVRMTEKRFKKVEAAIQDAPLPDRYGDPDAEIGIVTWGTTMGTVREAIDILTKRGLKVDAIAPKMLWPLPDHQLRHFIMSKRRIIVPEVNYSGQLATLLAARYRNDILRINTYGGLPFRVGEIVSFIESEVAQRV